MFLGLYEAGTFFILSRLGREAESQHSQDNIFHINTLSQDEKDALIYSNILSLKKQATRPARKKILPKLSNIKKGSAHEFTAVDQQSYLK